MSSESKSTRKLRHLTWLFGPKRMWKRRGSAGRGHWGGTRERPLWLSEHLAGVSRRQMERLRSPETVPKDHWKGMTPEISDALDRAGGRLREAARLLGMSEQGLRCRLRLTVPHS